MRASSMFPVYCDVCCKEGERARDALAPLGWFYLETNLARPTCDGERIGDDTAIYLVCSLACLQEAAWQRGPGSLKRRTKPQLRLVREAEPGVEYGSFGAHEAIHAIASHEYTFCGYALDAADSGDMEGGGTWRPCRGPVTCQGCADVVERARQVKLAPLRSRVENVR